MTIEQPVLDKSRKVAELIKKLPHRDVLEDWCGAVPGGFMGATYDELAVMAEFVLTILDLNEIKTMG